MTKLIFSLQSLIVTTEVILSIQDMLFSLDTVLWEHSVLDESVTCKNTYVTDKLGRHRKTIHLLDSSNKLSLKTVD